MTRNETRNEIKAFRFAKMGEIHETMTARQLCENKGIAPDTMRMRFAKLRETMPTVFDSAWRIDGELTTEQMVRLIEAGERKGGAPKETKSEAVAHPADIPMRPAQGQPNEVAPQGFGKTEKIQRTIFQKGLLAGVCVLCAGASVSNMLDISTQIKDSFAVACVITSIFTLSPFAVFYADVKPGVSWVVSGICIGYEVFCNTVGTYRGLANLGRGVPYEIWEPGGFIDSVSRVTTFEARPCALVVSGVMAAIIAGLFLICLNELKK